MSDINTMEDPSVYRELGSLSAKVEALETRTASIDEKLDTLLERSAKARGAASMLWKVGSASSAGGGLLVAIGAWLLDVFTNRGGH